MKFAIIADVHANLEAFQAVLADVKNRECTHYTFLEDFVGYCADPKACLDIVRSMNAPCVNGNHDEYCATDLPLNGFNPSAAKAVQWTRSQLSEDDRQWLHGLPYVRSVEGFTIVHATLDGPERWGYVFDKLAAAASLDHQSTRVCFFGHTHVPIAFTRDTVVRGGTYTKFKVERGKDYFVNRRPCRPLRLCSLTRRPVSRANSARFSSGVARFQILANLNVRVPKGMLCYLHELLTALNQGDDSMKTIFAMLAASAGLIGSTAVLLAADSPAAQQAVAVLHSTAGQKCHGIVRFTQDGDSVKVVADLEGLTPGQKHAFHIHQYGDCSAPDAMSAGGHYNPEGHQHGLPDAENRHAGDLGNVQADDQGKAHYEITVNNISVAGPKNSILGRAVIVHAKPDDGGQPVGNAGSRIGCGVIGTANPGK